jgi:hypothetical protein
MVVDQQLLTAGEFMVLVVGRGLSREFSARVHLYQMPFPDAERPDAKLHAPPRDG